MGTTCVQHLGLRLHAQRNTKSALICTSLYAHESCLSAADAASWWNACGISHSSSSGGGGGGGGGSSSSTRS